MYRIFFKRLFDIFFSFLVLVLVIPIILFFAILVSFESKGPIFFLQLRMGINGKSFTLYKLRSLKVNPNRKENQIFNNHDDMTAVGKFIRRFKIDELPQILNVLKGDMSIVGPRPCLPSLVEKFDENAFYRLKVRPGLTGWAQVNGNIHNSWPKRWEYDRDYVEQLSFSFDIKILFKTIFVILLGEKK